VHGGDGSIGGSGRRQQRDSQCGSGEIMRMKKKKERERKKKKRRDREREVQRGEGRCFWRSTRGVSGGQRREGEGGAAGTM